MLPDQVSEESKSPTRLRWPLAIDLHFACEFCTFPPSPDPCRIGNFAKRSATRLGERLRQRLKISGDLRMALLRGGFHITVQALDDVDLAFVCGFFQLFHLLVYLF